MEIPLQTDNEVNDTLNLPMRMDPGDDAEKNWFSYPQSYLFITLCVIATVLGVLHIFLLRTRFGVREFSKWGLETQTNTLSSNGTEMEPENIETLQAFFYENGLPALASDDSQRARKLYRMLLSPKYRNSLEIFKGGEEKRADSMYEEPSVQSSRQNELINHSKKIVDDNIASV